MAALITHNYRKFATFAFKQPVFIPHKQFLCDCAGYTRWIKLFWKRALLTQNWMTGMRQLPYTHVNHSVWTELNTVKHKQVHPCRTYCFLRVSPFTEFIKIFKSLLLSTYRPSYSTGQTSGTLNIKKCFFTVRGVTGLICSGFKSWSTYGGEEKHMTWVFLCNHWLVMCKLVYFPCLPGH